MRQSTYFIKTLREPPKDEMSVNARLLEQACCIYKLMAGVYAFLPLGLRVLNRVNRIIREEMEKIGGQELYMPAMQPQELWLKTNRWNDLKNIMYQFQDKSDHWLGLATTHEETITEIVKQKITSYKDLPLFLFQIQDKFRNEPRAKSGLIRGREFAMKDLYSFHADEKDLDQYYQKVAAAYHNIFKRCGLDAMIIEASGGSFSKNYSHEFQVLSAAGEDRIIYCTKQDFAQNLEISKFKQGDACPKCATPLKSGKGIEVGNIFKLGTRFSSTLGAYYSDSHGEKKPIIMASYGIGPGRLMGTIVEIHHDADGIIWPKEVTPFHVHLLNLAKNDTKANKLYHALIKKGLATLIDDRQVSSGVKLKDADLIGIAVRGIISDKTLDKVEIKFRNEPASRLMSQSEFIKTVNNFYQT